MKVTIDISDDDWRLMKKNRFGQLVSYTLYNSELCWECWVEFRG